MSSRYEMRNPKLVFLENVKHLVHHDKGLKLKIIIKDLELLGYKVRERHVIIRYHKEYFDLTKL